MVRQPQPGIIPTSAMKPTRHLVIAGATPQESAEIAAFLRGLHHQLDHDWLMAEDGEEIDLVITDLSDFGGRCARIRALDEGRHLIVIADPGAEVLDSELVLLRPLVPKAIIGLLNHVGSTTPPQPRRLIDFSVHEREIGKRHAAHAAKAKADAEGSDTRANFLDIQYERPCTSLDALVKRGALLIQRPGLPPLLIDPVTDLFHSSARMCQLEPYFLEPLQGQEYQRVGGEKLARLQGEHEGRPLVRLRWLNAFLRSNGYLAKHLDPTANYQLKHWLPLDNDYRKQHRIALTLMREAPLHVIAQRAKARMADVFDVVNAYDRLGLLEVRRASKAGSSVSHGSAKTRKLLAVSLFPR